MTTDRLHALALLSFLAGCGGAPGDDARIVQFEVAPQELFVGETVTVSWVVDGVDFCDLPYIGGGPHGPTGFAQLIAWESMTFDLRCGVDDPEVDRYVVSQTKIAIVPENDAPESEILSPTATNVRANELVFLHGECSDREDHAPFVGEWRISTTPGTAYPLYADAVTFTFDNPHTDPRNDEIALFALDPERPQVELSFTCTDDYRIVDPTPAAITLTIEP